jgi:hypothetical protein
MEDAVDEADAGRLVWVLVGELDVDFPEAAEERCCWVVICVSVLEGVIELTAWACLLSSGPLKRT